MGYTSNKTASGRSNINSTLEQFRNISGIGILSPARYEIVIASPSPIIENRNISTLRSMGFSGTDAMRRLSETCEVAMIPGRNISSQPNKILGGQVREMPYESIYSGDLDLTFRIGQDMFERVYFEKWMDSVINKDNHNHSYYDNYTRDIYISQLTQDDSVVYQVVLRECYPKTVNPLPLSAATTNDYQKQSVSIAFRKYEVIDSDTTEESAPRTIRQGRGFTTPFDFINDLI
jgi:hypothetical protein